MTKSMRLAEDRVFQRVPRSGRWLAALLILSSPLGAAAQTWGGNIRQRPSLREIAVIDETGESNWLWGTEDVAGDGLAQFTAEERAIDARTVYLRVENDRLWWRTYVSSASSPGSNLTAYLFVDSDLSSATGRSAAAIEIDPALTSDPSQGGYEYVISVRGDGSEPAAWELNATQTAFVEVPILPNTIDGESNSTLDPLRIGGVTNGYVQASIPATVLRVDARCQARFYVRTTNQTQALGPGDLDVGEAISCAPTDTNANAVPDLLEPVAQCVTDSQCPNGGICWRGRCWLAPVCLDDADCAPNETCTDGRCLVTPGATCRVDDDCASGVCENGRCIACTSDAACGAESVCGPDGRCVAENVAGPSASGAGGAGNDGSNSAGAYGIVLAEGERIQGGPCACRYASSDESRSRLGWVALGAGLFIWHRRRTARRGPLA